MLLLIILLMSLLSGAGRSSNGQSITRAPVPDHLRSGKRYSYPFSDQIASGSQEIGSGDDTEPDGDPVFGNSGGDSASPPPSLPVSEVPALEPLERLPSPGSDGILYSYISESVHIFLHQI